MIQKAKNDGFDVACVISGNFVQRGDTAIIPKFRRAETALLAGADIVLELPVPWSMSTAQNFALGGVSQLSAIGIDSLYFGSESGDKNELLRVADILSSDTYNLLIKERLASGITFAKLRSDIVSDLLGRDSDVLLNPNDTLAVEYILAGRKLGLSVDYVPVERIGASHNDKEEQNGYSTATLLREAINNNDYGYVTKYLSEEIYDIVSDSPKSDIEKLDIAVISKLKQMSLDEFGQIADMSEGLDNLMYKSLRECFTVSELLDKVKSKRYTMARLRRLILSAFLDINRSFFLKEPPYVRVLGFRKNGEKYLCGNGIKPIITKISQIEKLDDISKKVFNKENSINEIYALSLDNPGHFIDERQEAIIRV